MKFQVTTLLLSLAIISFAQKNNINNLAFVDAGKTYINGQEYQLDAFYIYKTEISNKEYKEFLNYLEENKQSDLLAKCKVNHDGWKNVLEYSKPYESYYFEKSDYEDYPVVNITFDAANAFCEYLTIKYAKEYGLDVEFMLPSLQQWVRAAKGDKKENVYAWGSNELKNKKGLQGNFNVNDDTITAMVESYFPNKFGLYNMSGNVAEMTSKMQLAVGGSWNCVPEESLVEGYQIYENYSATVGFRPIMIIR